MSMTTMELVRWSGLAAIIAGVIFAGIQPIHPPDVLASVTTPAWAVIISLKLVMCFLFLLGITGIYARQVAEAGWMGLAGFVLAWAGWALQSGFVFTELFVLPPLATAAPEFVESFLALGNNEITAEMNIGAAAPAYAAVGVLYLLGGLVFGIATVRAGVLPRWPAALLAVTALLTPLAALLPHWLQRYAAIPMGIAFVGLGYALWTERSAQRLETVRAR
jgi:hypothetical protein